MMMLCKGCLREFEIIGLCNYISISDTVTVNVSLTTQVALELYREVVISTCGVDNLW